MSYAAAASTGFALDTTFLPTLLCIGASNRWLPFGRKVIGRKLLTLSYRCRLSAMHANRTITVIDVRQQADDARFNHIATYSLTRRKLK